MMKNKYAVILGFLGELQDRFSVYHERNTVKERIGLASEIQGINGIEPVLPFDFKNVNSNQLKGWLSECRLEVSSVNVNIKSESKFHLGALTSLDAGIRAEAINYIKAGMDWAADLGNNLVTVCPLSDGNDYPFEIDYKQSWTWLIDALGEAAEYRPDVLLSVEYKPNEPRARVIVPNGGVVLFLCEQIGLPNVGATVDIGHAIYAGETPAQIISMAHLAGRLFLIHINDNYRNFDWDLLPGTVNYWEWLETLWVLDELDYKGWLVADVFPARTDPVKTFSACYRIIEHSLALLDIVGKETLRKKVSKRDAFGLFDEIQKTINGVARNLA